MPDILKKLSILFAGFALMFGLVESENENVETEKALIVYFSHTGNTKLIAEKAQKGFTFANYQIDLRRIEPTKPNALNLRKTTTPVFNSPISFVTVVTGRIER